MPTEPERIRPCRANEIRRWIVGFIGACFGLGGLYWGLMSVFSLLFFNSDGGVIFWLIALVIPMAAISALCLYFAYRAFSRHWQRSITSMCALMGLAVFAVASDYVAPMINLEALKKENHNEQIVLTILPLVIAFVAYYLMMAFLTPVVEESALKQTSQTEQQPGER